MTLCTESACRLLLSFFWPCLAACRILVLWSGIEPRPLAVKLWSPNHWIAREFPTIIIYIYLLCMYSIYFKICLCEFQSPFPLEPRDKNLLQWLLLSKRGWPVLGLTATWDCSGKTKAYLSSSLQLKPQVRLLEIHKIFKARPLLHHSWSTLL